MFRNPSLGGPLGSGTHFATNYGRRTYPAPMDFLAQPTHLLFLLVIVLLFFGTSRLPQLARSLREARDEFTKKPDDDAAPASSSDDTPSAPA